MKKIKRLIPIVLSLVFVISAFMTVSAIAAPSGTAEQDGIVATLTCDKTEYSANEKVAVTLTVKNNNPYSVEGIETEIILPDGIKTESGELKQTAFTLNAGESKDGSVTLVKIPEKPIASNSPQTGDHSLVGLYAVIMLLSGGAMVVIGIKEKWFRKKGVMSLILCFAMVGTVLSPLAVNAASTSKNFTVENMIKYGGKNVTIKANISYLYEKHNKVTFNGTDTYYAVGDTVEITAPEPEEGKHFDHWTAVNGDVTFADPNKSSTTFVMPDGEVELKANYAPNTYTITVTSGDNGAISPAGEVNVEYGQNQTFTITPNTGYHIVDVEVDGESKGAITSYTFENVKEPHTIKAVFAIDTFTITASVNNSSMGTITETANVNYGDSKTFTMTANTGYGVKDVKVDGTSVGPVTSYTFENVNGNHTIEVEFDTATTVTTVQQFRDAVKQDGIIILANDITLDDNGDVEISKNVIIHGSGHSVIMPVYSGENWSHPVLVKTIGDAKIKIENCLFKQSGGNVALLFGGNSIVQIYSGTFDRICVDGFSALRFYGGTIKQGLAFSGYSSISLIGGFYHKDVSFTWDMFQDDFEGSLSLLGGTYYFDPTSYLDSDKFEATQTKDADNVDIWVVTEK